MERSQAASWPSARGLSQGSGGEGRSGRVRPQRSRAGVVASDSGPLAAGRAGVLAAGGGLGVVVMGGRAVIRRRRGIFELLHMMVNALPRRYAARRVAASSALRVLTRERARSHHRHLSDPCAVHTYIHTLPYSTSLSLHLRPSRLQRCLSQRRRALHAASMTPDGRSQ